MTPEIGDRTRLKPAALALTAALSASVLASLDLFLVNLAFPQISQSFSGATPQSLAWVLNAYLLAFGVFLTPAGRLADRHGRRSAFRIGLVIFGLGTLAAALSPTVELLVAARAAQGVAAAVIVPTSLALLLSQTSKEHHKRVISVWAAAGSVAAAAGPVLGGVLADIDWRLVFLVKLPFVVLALCATRAFPPDTRGKSRPGGVNGAGAASRTGGTQVTGIAGKVSSARLFRATSPDFLQPAFLAAVIGMASFYLGFSIMLLGGAMWTTAVWGWNSAATGLAFAAGPGTAVISALVAGRSSLQARWFAVIGGGLFLACGLLWAVAFAPETSSPWLLLGGLVLTGAAAGIGQTGFLAVGTATLPAEQHSTATGVLSTARQIGSTAGVWILVVIIGDGTTGAAYPLAWLVMGAAGAVAALSPFLARMRFDATRIPPAPSSNHRTRD